MEPSHDTETTKWWQRDMVRLGILSIVFVVAIILLYQVKWSGLRGKNVWDWMDLIIVPLVLASGGLLLQRIEDQRTEREEAREKQQAREGLMDSIFQSYLDDMSDLMINHQLQTNLDIVTAHREQKKAKSNPDNESEGTGEKPSDEPVAAYTVDAARLAEATAVVTVARARTVTVLKSLDVTRRNLLGNFLRETALVTGKHGTLLTYVDLSSMDLSRTDFYNFNFTGSLFYRTNLSRTNLLKTNFNNAYLFRANLSGADISNSTFCQACLHQAMLEHAYLENVQFDDKTVPPDAEPIEVDVASGQVTYTKFWSEDTDMERYTNRDHPDFWEQPDGGVGISKWAVMAKLGSVDS